MNSTNTVVANAMAAHGVARNAYCEAGDYIETRDGGQDTVERVVGDKVYLKSGEVIRMSDVKSVLNAKREISLNAKRMARNATGYVKIASELDLIESACIKAERAMELEGARISLKPIMDAYRKVRAQVADWWEDKKRRETL